MMMLLAALLAAEAANAAVPATPGVAKPAAPAEAVARPTRAQVLAAVRSEWAQHDKGNKGRLTPLEFGTWVMRSHGATVADRPRGQGIAPVSAMNASATAFARADANHDGGVTPEEMASFLMLPPAPTALQRARAAEKPAAGPAKPVSTVKADSGG